MGGSGVEMGIRGIKGRGPKRGWEGKRDKVGGEESRLGRRGEGVGSRKGGGGEDEETLGIEGERVRWVVGEVDE